MALNRLEHFTINVSDLDRSVSFYSDVLGLRNGDRPPFDFPGAWLYCGDTPVVHLIAGRAGPPGAGSLDHVAFRASDLNGLRGRLTTNEISFDENDLPDRPLHQVFFKDPDGVKIELNFWDEVPA